MALIYDKCIYPSIADIAPEHMSHWPLTYDMALEKAGDVQGRLHLSSIDISPDSAIEFSGLLLDRLAEHRGFEDAFFYHEWRGLKGITAHDGIKGRQVDRSFRYLLDDVDIARITPDDWCVDVAVELHAPGKVLQWRKAAHPGVTKFLIPDISRRHQDTLHRSRNFHVDLSALLYELAGFRTVVPNAYSDLTISYINVYTTDKQSTYQQHLGIFRHHRVKEILPAKLSSLLKDVSKIADTFGKCSEGRPQEGCARMEIRMSIEDAQQSLRTIPMSFVVDSIVIIDARVWWYVFSSTLP